MEEPSYNFDFAAGRAALAQGNLELARHHFELLHARFPSSALARYALGDLLLWQNMEFDRAHELLTTALADPFRMDLPHWKRLGFEAQLLASHAWSLAVIGRPEELQYNLDLATELAGRKKPVQAEVHLRLATRCGRWSISPWLMSIGVRRGRSIRMGGRGAERRGS
jgi:tetratricopeptide (TPR) repeat protein